MFPHRIALSALGLAAMLQPLSVCAFQVPPNDGFVTDTVGVLSQEEEQELESVLSAYRAQTSNEIAVVIVESMNGEPLVDAAVDIGRTWGVGTEENDNGIVLLIAYADREMFLATGYGLEGAVPDIVAKGIIDTEITPHFRDGEFAEGIAAGIAALKSHIGGEYTAERYASSGSEASWPFVIFFSIFGLTFLSAIAEGLLIALAPSRSWWVGGVVGFLIGMVLTISGGWWWSIPIFVMMGLVFNFIVSRLYHFDSHFAHFVKRRKKRRNRSGGPWGGRGGGSSGGGFGGFSGGSFGGGGSRGSW